MEPADRSADVPDVIELLQKLVATPSISGSEEAVAQLVCEWAERHGLSVLRDETAVRIELLGNRPGPSLALVSHLDVVPPGTGWTRDPFAPVIEHGRMYGRGSCDAKASVAAMLYAALDLLRDGGLGCGRLLVVLGYCEETRDTTMPRAVPRCGALDAAVIGEPTGLEFAVAQRGLMVAELCASGDQRHAAYASEGGEFKSAVLQLAADLLKVPTLLQAKPHALLGQPTLSPTMLEAGVARNVTPPWAKALLDLRTTPAWTHQEVARELRSALGSEVSVLSERLVPCETPQGSRLLAAAESVRPTASRYGSPTCSDWVFLRHLDALKCGPGESRRSHTADEWVALSEVIAARHFYRELARRYLSEPAQSVRSELS